MRSGAPTKGYSWQFVATGSVALIAGAWLAWLEAAFASSWMPSTPAYLSPIATGIATFGLLTGMVLLHFALRFAFPIIALSAAVAAFCVLVFVVQIVPVAQGNNDSGEVFWPVMLPGLLLAGYAYRAFLNDRQIRNPR